MKRDDFPLIKIGPINDSLNDSLRVGVDKITFITLLSKHFIMTFIFLISNSSFESIKNSIAK